MSAATPTPEALDRARSLIDSVRRILLSEKVEMRELDPKRRHARWPVLQLGPPTVSIDNPTIRVRARWQRGWKLEMELLRIDSWGDGPTARWQVSPDAPIIDVLNQWVPKVFPTPVEPLSCQSSRGDGECHHPGCPQLRDREPECSGRSCPLLAPEPDDEDEPTADDEPNLGTPLPLPASMRLLRERVQAPVCRRSARCSRRARYIVQLLAPARWVAACERCLVDALEAAFTLRPNANPTILRADREKCGATGGLKAEPTPAILQASRRRAVGTRGTRRQR